LNAEKSGFRGFLEPIQGGPETLLMKGIDGESIQEQEKERRFLWGVILGESRNSMTS